MLVLALTFLLLLPMAANAADTINVYTAWPESLSQPIFKAYTAKTGVQINFLRLSTGELVARATAEKGNPRADVYLGRARRRLRGGEGSGDHRAVQSRPRGTASPLS